MATGRYDEMGKRKMMKLYRKELWVVAMETS